MMATAHVSTASTIPAPTGYRDSRSRVLGAFLVLLAVQGIGATGYFYLGWRFREDLWSFWDCLYMTAITVSTVGFGEVLDVTTVPGGRAKGIVVTLDDDKTNMFVVISARQANPCIRIVAKTITQSAIAKLRRAGADAVVSPNFIGGLRLASELLRPQVVRFLDQMLRENAGLRIEEATVGDEGPTVGR